MPLKQIQTAQEEKYETIIYIIHRITKTIEKEKQKKNKIYMTSPANTYLSITIISYHTKQPNN